MITHSHPGPGAGAHRRHGQRALIACCAGALLISQANAGVPDFVPSPSGMYEDFTSLEEPRAEVPVGALWIQGFGPHGAGASPDNLETIRGLSGLTLSRNLQLSLTLGLANFLRIDPGLRNQISARFSDLSIVRVKDVSKLTGPAGEPRIYEALRAATITVTTDSNMGLDVGGNIAASGLPVVSRGNAGRTRSFTIDAREMFIAFRVVTPQVVRTRPKEARINRAAATSLVLDTYQVHIDASALNTCVETASTADQLEICKREKDIGLAVSRPSSGDASVGTTQIGSYNMVRDAERPVAITLAVPLSDGRSGLFTTIIVRVAVEIDEAPNRREGQGPYSLSARSRATAAFQGTRLETLGEPRSRGW